MEGQEAGMDKPVAGTERGTSKAKGAALGLPRGSFRASFSACQGPGHVPITPGAMSLSPSHVCVLVTLAVEKF